MKVFYDLESTGYEGGPPVYKQRIVQICVEIENGEIFSSHVNPGCHIPQPSEAIHRVSNEIAEKAKPWDTVFKQIINFILNAYMKRARHCNQSHPSIYFIAHNNFGFDCILFHIECQRMGIPIPSYIKFLDTLPYFKKHYQQWNELPPEERPFNLGNMYQRVFQEPLEGAHDAKADVVALKKLVDHTRAPFSEAESRFQWLKDSNHILDIKWIGLTRGLRIEAYLNQHKGFRLQGYKTVGDLRQLSSVELETMLRAIKMKQDSCIVAVLSQILKKPVWVIHNQYPYMGHALHPIRAMEDRKMFIHHGLRTMTDIQCMYAFQCKENTDAFKETLLKMGITPKCILKCVNLYDIK